VIWRREIFRPRDVISERSLDVNDGWLWLDPDARLWLVDR
jgi:hypothetical protein